MPDLAASFQNAVVEVLVSRTIEAAKQRYKRVAGGVASTPLSGRAWRRPVKGGHSVLPSVTDLLYGQCGDDRRGGAMNIRRGARAGTGSECGAEFEAGREIIQIFFRKNCFAVSFLKILI